MMLRIADEEARALGYIYGFVSAKMPEEFDRSGSKHAQAMQYPFFGAAQIIFWGHKYDVITADMDRMIAEISKDINTIPEGSVAEQLLPTTQQSIWTLAYYAGLNGKPYYDIAKHREQVGMSQEDLAEKLGIPQSSISRWESGKVQPRAETIEKIKAIIKEKKAERKEMGMMTFTVIKASDSETRAMDGYHFVGSAQIDKTAAPDRSEGWYNMVIDSFFDGWEKICRGDDGKLYLVDFDIYSHKPLVWCEVEED